jgi:hypothetical protein
VNPGSGDGGRSGGDPLGGGCASTSVNVDHLNSAGTGTGMKYETRSIIDVSLYDYLYRPDDEEFSSLSLYEFKKMFGVCACPMALVANHLGGIAICLLRAIH